MIQIDGYADEKNFSVRFPRNYAETGPKYKWDNKAGTGLTALSLMGLCFNLLVARNKELHDAPAYEIGHAADTEHNEVACGLACKAHE